MDRCLCSEQAVREGFLLKIYDSLMINEFVFTKFLLDHNRLGEVYSCSSIEIYETIGDMPLIDS